MATKDELTRLILSAVELHSLTQDRWPQSLIEDYLNILDDFNTVSDAIDTVDAKTIEEFETNFLDYSIVFAEGGKIRQDNPAFIWNPSSNTLNIVGDADIDGNLTLAKDFKGRHRAKMYFFGNF